MAEENKIYDIRGMSAYSRLQEYTSYQPTEVGTFTIDSAGKFANCDGAKLPTLKDFKLPLFLNKGYKSGVKTVETLENTSTWEEELRWIKKNSGGYKSVSDVDVITERSILKDIANTNHDCYKISWKFEACKFKGKLYIRRSEEEVKEDVKEPDLWAEKYAYWRKKFEDLVLERDSGTTSTHRMLKGNVGSKKVLLSSEVDAVTDEGNHLAVRTCFVDKLTAKIPLAWLQCHLGKVDVLYFGFMDKRGTVPEMPTEISVQQIPGMYVKAYEANAMIGFLGDVLDWVFEELPDKDESSVLEYIAGSREIMLKSQGKKFLPKWYLQCVSACAKKDKSS